MADRSTSTNLIANALTRDAPHAADRAALLRQVAELLGAGQAQRDGVARADQIPRIFELAAHADESRSDAPEVFDRVVCTRARAGDCGKPVRDRWRTCAGDFSECRIDERMIHIRHQASARIPQSRIRASKSLRSNCSVVTGRMTPIFVGGRGICRPVCRPPGGQGFTRPGPPVRRGIARARQRQVERYPRRVQPADQRERPDAIAVGAQRVGRNRVRDRDWTDGGLRAFDHGIRADAV